MSIKISFKKNIGENKIKNYVLFSDENFKVLGLNNTILSKDSGIINKIIANDKIKDQRFLTFNLNSNQKVVIVKIKNNSSSIENEKTGAQFYNYIKEHQMNNSTLLENNFKEFVKKNRQK